MGSWKRKIGNVVKVNESNLVVDVDTIVAIDPESYREIGKRKLLKKPKRYTPRARFCRKI